MSIKYVFEHIFFIFFVIFSAKVFIFVNRNLTRKGLLAPLKVGFGIVN